MKKITILLLLLSALTLNASKSIPMSSNGIRNSAIANVKGKDVVYISEIDGSIGLYTLGGKKVWRKNTPNASVNFEIAVVDIDGDKSDDVITVNGDGSVCAYDSKGKALWKFKNSDPVRLNEIATIGYGKNLQIFVGGNNYTLYELDSNGKLVSKTPVTGSIRKIESGKFLNKNEEILFVYTLKHDKFGSAFFGFIDPKTKQIIKTVDLKKKSKKDFEIAYATGIITDFEIADINDDGLDNIIIFANNKSGICIAYDSKLNELFNYSEKKPKIQRYAHAKGISLSPVRDEIVMQYGGVITVLDKKGNLIGMSGQRYREVIFNDFILDTKNKKLYGTGQVGGDNTLYEFDLTKDDWYKTKHQFDGRYKEIEDNLITLYDQTLKFQLPSYQTKVEEPFIMVNGRDSNLDEEIAHLNGGNIIFVNETTITENYDRSFIAEKVGDALANKRDHRKPYDKTQAQILQWAKDREDNNAPFSLWAGHGGDPFYMDITTMEKMIAIAPNACRGLLFAEFESTKDPRILLFIKEYIPRIAKAIEDNKANTKLYFRFKNMFWAADVNTSEWKKIFFSKKYKDILVPAAEDTNNRVQDINFTGRVGMWASGYINDYAMRLVDDNPTSWRPLSAGGQRSASHYIRNGVLMAAYGSRHGVLVNIGYFENKKYYPMFALMKAGVLPVLKPDDILSIGSWMLINDIDEEYMHQSSGGHDLIKYNLEDANGLIGLAGLQWCGAAIFEDDYSSMLGVKYRWLNFIPEMPNGMIPITSVDYEKTLKKNKANYFVSDIKSGYINGKKTPFKEFAPYMKKQVEDGAKKLLLNVEGASWGLFKIGDNHARLVLVDQGYVDPQERTATITFQTQQPKSATDILSKEGIDVKDKKSIKLKVPAGSMRFIDFEFEKPITKGN